MWTAEQLAGFPLAGFPLAGRSARLVATRNPSLAGDGVVVQVRAGQMSQVQALALLQAGLPTIPTGVATALVAERCPHTTARELHPALNGQA
jgi:hypothetical protein